MKVLGAICPRHPELSGLQYARHRNGKSRAGTCVACSNEQGRRWRKENKEKFSAICRAWRANNPEKARAKDRRSKLFNKEKVALRNKLWRLKNAETLKLKDKEKRKQRSEYYRAKMREWYGKNRHLVYTYNGKRRALTRMATPSWSNQFFMGEIYDLAQLRTKMTGIKWSVDHIVPLRNPAVCGLHTEQNLQVIPTVHNLSKNNRTWPDMP